MHIFLSTRFLSTSYGSSLILNAFSFNITKWWKNNLSVDFAMISGARVFVFVLKMILFYFLNCVEIPPTTELILFEPISRVYFKN